MKLTFLLAIILATTVSVMAQASSTTQNIKYYGKRASAPTTCTASKKGYQYFNTSDNLQKICNGTTWESIGSAGAGDALTGNSLAQFAATTSAELRGVLSDETGTGIALFQGGNYGTPSAIVLTNATGTAASLTAGLATALAANPTDCNANEFATSIVASGNLTCSIPAIANISGLGTGVATALAVNVGSAGAFVTFNGAGGTPSSMTGTNITGTAAGLTAGTVTTNANLSGVVVSSGSNVTTPGKADVMQTSLYCSDAGANDTYACNLAPVATAYVTGTTYRFKANTSNTGAATVNFNTLGPLTIKKVQGAITTDLADNDIRANQWVECIYDGTNCQMISQLGNSPSASISGTDTRVLFFDGDNTPAGEGGLTYNKNTDTLTVAGAVTVSGSQAGTLTLTEGTAPSAAGANTIQVQAPADVTTAYDLILPAASSTGLVLGTNSSNVNTLSFLATGSGVTTFLGTPSSANLRGALTDENGTGASLFNGATSPDFTTSLTTGSSTFALLNTTATTVNAFGAATTLNFGASATQILNFGGSTTASEFRFLEPSGSGTNYSAFKAGAQGASITYTLPPTVGGAGTFLRDAAGDGVLSWAAPAGSGTVTNTGGDLTSNSVVLGAGTTDTKVVAGITTNGTAQLVLGVNTTTLGSVKLFGNTSGDATISPAAVAGTATALTLPATSDTLVGKATVDDLTNKTLSAEGTGNVITIPFKTYLPAAGCSNVTAYSFYNLFTSLQPTPTCVTGTNRQKGILAFPDSDGEYQAQAEVLLPADFSGAIDVKIRWYAAATTGDVVWQVACICTADAETDDPAFNTSSTVTDTTKGTTLQMNDATITGLTATGCAAGEMLNLKIFRQRTHASDTITGVVNLVGMEVTMRRAM